MDKKQQDQLKKWLVFGGLGLLFVLSMWFIFAPSGKEKTAAQQGLNDSIPQASVEELPGNKLKAYEQGNKSAEEQQAKAEMAEVSDEFAAQNAAEEAERVEASRSRSKIERSMQRYAENNRLLNDFYATDPSEKEREELRSQVAELKNELAKKNDKQENEEERQLALMEKSYQMAAKYLPKSTPNNPTELNNAFAQAQERTIVAPSSDKQSEGAKAVEVLPERKQVVSSLSGAMSDADFVKMYGTKGRNLAFHSMNNEKKEVERNTIRVQIDHTLVLKEGDDVVLRLLENARIGDLHLPRRVASLQVPKSKDIGCYYWSKALNAPGAFFLSNSRLMIWTDRKVSTFLNWRTSLPSKKWGLTSGEQWERVLPSLLLPKTKSSRKRHAG